MGINWDAVTFWGFCTALGYVLGGADGAMIGLTVALGLSFLAAFL